jgi:hypothetical protein
VVLLPENLHGFRIEVQRLPQGTLDVLNRDLFIGFALLRETFLPLDEYAIEPSEAHRNDELASCRRFFWVRPRSGAEQCQVMLQLLRQADAAGLRVLVLPELCHSINRGHTEDHTDTWQAAIDWFMGEERKHLRVVIAGSRHVERETERGPERRNELLILVQGCPPWVHNKFNPMSLGHERSSMQREHIHTSPRSLTLFLDQDWSFVPLICKDFLLNQARALLQSLRPGLVLISSMSEKTQDFERDALGLTSGCQAIVIYANTALELPGRVPTAPAALGFITRPLLETTDEPSRRSKVSIETPHPQKCPRKEWAARTSPLIGATSAAAALERWPIRHDETARSENT